MADDSPVRWLIVCDCAGRPEELIGAVDLNAAGAATVWATGRNNALPSLKGANRLILSTPPGQRRDLVNKLRSREIRLRKTVTFSHSPCGKSIRVNEDGLAELLAAVSSVVEDQRITLALLCAVNGKLRRGATR